MNRRPRTMFSRLIAGVLLLSLLPSAGCNRKDGNTVQGYVEGEFVYVASPLAGSLQKLGVRRGERVTSGTPLFALDSIPETAARDEAARKLAQARATLEDLRKGKRPSELDALEAQLRT